MRKCLEREFSAIYVFNLRGNQRTSGELSRKEGGKIFGSGSRTPIAITILVKKPKTSDEAARICYHDIGDYLSREEKLNILHNMGDVSNPLMQWVSITPNEHGDWLNKRSEQFKLYTPLEPEKKFGKGNKSFFEGFSLGLGTNRDAWVYNSSLVELQANITKTIDFYNQQVESYKTAKQEMSLDNFLADKRDSTKIVWTDTLIRDLRKGIKYAIDTSRYTVGMYRPYFKQALYQDRILNHRVYQMPRLFPTPNHRNLVICVSGHGGNKENCIFISNSIVDLNCLDAGTQCFPLYWYDDSTADIADLFSAQQSDADRYVRRDGVTDWILSTARKQYGSRVTKEDIFYYVYGILHAPDYRTTFAADLKKSLPRLPLVESPDDFWAFSRAGRSLAELHLGYEYVEPYAGCHTVNSTTSEDDAINYRVEKMRFGKLDSKTADKSIIHYNAGITIESIPLEAYDYVVNGKSAIEWVMERYAVKTDSTSLITNAPNDWCREHDDPKYIYNLLLRIITVSLETMKIVHSLPKLKLEE